VIGQGRAKVCKPHTSVHTPVGKTPREDQKKRKNCFFETYEELVFPLRKRPEKSETLEERTLRGGGRTELTHTHRKSPETGGLARNNSACWHKMEKEETRRSGLWQWEGNRGAVARGGPLRQGGG